MIGLNQGTKIGQYVLDHQLGEGGQGSVWQAHAVFATPGTPVVALKVIPTAGASQVTVERFRREAEALTKLSAGHPSLVGCYGVVEDPPAGVMAVVMEKVEGLDLQATLLDPRCDQRAREHILLHIARALAHLHEAGFVHRDIKPQNILVTHRFFDDPTDPSTVRLVDFGIAIPISNPKPLTEVGTVIGTPGYMSPERIDPLFWQARPGLPTEDVWAFGVVAYEAFFGRHPSGVNEDDGLLSAYAERYRALSRAHEPWPSVSEAHPWSQALRGALALRAADRLPTGAAVASVVTQRLSSVDDLARRGRPVARTEMQSPASFGLVASPSEPPPVVQARTPITGGQRTEVAPAQAYASAAPPYQQTDRSSTPPVGAWGPASPGAAVGYGTPSPAGYGTPSPAAYGAASAAGYGIPGAAPAAYPTPQPAVAAYPPPVMAAPAKKRSALRVILPVGLLTVGIACVGVAMSGALSRTGTDDDNPPVAPSDSSSPGAPVDSTPAPIESTTAVPTVTEPPPSPSSKVAPVPTHHEQHAPASPTHSAHPYPTSSTVIIGPPPTNTATAPPGPTQPTIWLPPWLQPRNENEPPPNRPPTSSPPQSRPPMRPTPGYGPQNPNDAPGRRRPGSPIILHP